MRIALERDAGLAALGRLQSVVTGKFTIPVINNVLLEADEADEAADSLRLTATDLDAQIAETMACAVAEGGKTTVEARLLFDLFRNFPAGGEVVLSLTGEDRRLIVKCGRSTYRLPVLPAADFPVFNESGLSWTARLPGPAARRLLDCTSGFVGHEETRPMLMGVHLHAETVEGAECVVAVATDGHRLGKAFTEAPGSLPADAALTAPTKAVQGMQRLLDGVTCDVEIAGGESLLALRTPTTTMLTKLVDYPYPDYHRVIPTANEREVRGKRADIVQAVKRVSLVADRGEKVVAVRFQLEPGRLTLSGRNEQTGQGTEELEVEYEGEPFEIGFNSRLLLDVLASIESVNLRILLGEDSSRAALLLDDTDARRLFVLMPCRV